MLLRLLLLLLQRTMGALMVGNSSAAVARTNAYTAAIVAVGIRHVALLRVAVAIHLRHIRRRLLIVVIKLHIITSLPGVRLSGVVHLGAFRGQVRHKLRKGSHVVEAAADAVVHGSFGYRIVSGLVDAKGCRRSAREARNGSCSEQRQLRVNEIDRSGNGDPYLSNYTTKRLFRTTGRLL